MFKDRYDTIITIKMFATILAFFVVYGFVSDDDYHKIVARITPIKYNCDMLIGGWHPDVPAKVIEQCRKRMYGNEENKNSN
jgi:hypothetical protein